MSQTFWSSVSAVMWMSTTICFATLHASCFYFKWKEHLMVWKQESFYTYQYWKHIFNVEKNLPETTFMVNFGAFEPLGLANCWQGIFPGNRYFRCSGSNFTNLCGYWYDSRSCQDDSLKFKDAIFGYKKLMSYDIGNNSNEQCIYWIWIYFLQTCFSLLCQVVCKRFNFPSKVVNLTISHIVIFFKVFRN